MPGGRIKPVHRRHAGLVRAGRTADAQPAGRVAQPMPGLSLRRVFIHTYGLNA